MVFALPAAFAPLDAVVNLCTIGTLATMAAVNVSVITLRRREPGLARTFRVPLYPATPLLGVGFCLYLMYETGGATWLQFAVFLAVGLLVYSAYGAGTPAWPGPPSVRTTLSGYRRKPEPDRLARPGGPVPAGRAEGADQQQTSPVLAPRVGRLHVRPGEVGRRRRVGVVDLHLAAGRHQLHHQLDRGRAAGVCSTALATSSAVSSSAVSPSAVCSSSARALRTRARATGTAAAECGSAMRQEAGAGK